MKHINDIFQKDVRSVEVAEAQKSKLIEIKNQITIRIDQLKNEIPSVEKESAKKTLDDVLSGGTIASKSLEKLSMLETELKVKIKALVLIDEIFPQCLRNLWASQAVEKRAEAIKIRNEAAERLKTVNPLLAQLKEFEKVDFAPVRPDFVHINPGLGGAPTIQVVRISVTQGLIQQAERLEAIAEGLQRQSETGDIEPKIIWDLSEDIKNLEKLAG